MAGQGRAGRGCGPQAALPFPPGLQTGPKPASCQRGCLPWPPPPLFQQLPPCHLSFLPSVSPSPPRRLHGLSPALALWSTPSATTTCSAAAFALADRRSVHFHPGLFPSVPRMPAGRASSSSANPCVVTAGKTEPWTREGLPMGSPEDTHIRWGQSPQNASGAPQGGLWGARRERHSGPRGSKPGTRAPPASPGESWRPNGVRSHGLGRSPPLGCAAGLWVGRRFLVRAGCGETGHVGLQVPVLAGRETFRSRTVGEGCSRPCQAPEPSEHLVAREHRWAPGVDPTRTSPHRCGRGSASPGLSWV